MKVIIVNGPNLNLLGKREKNYYGSTTLKEINLQLEQLALELNIEIDFFQSNHEGEIIDYLQKRKVWANYAIINLGGYTHTSVAIRDALLACSYKFIEVHISNIYNRDTFRKTSLISDIAMGQIIGLGTKGYLLALRYLKEEL